MTEGGNPRWQHYHVVSYFAWIQVFRDFSAPAAVKDVGYALATYATFSTGKEAYPGLDNLMTATGYNSKQTIVTALAKLRELGFIYRAFSGSSVGRRGLADEYYLTIHDELRREAGHDLCKCKDKPDPKPEGDVWAA